MREKFALCAAEMTSSDYEDESVSFIDELP
jgi:hypothetical protein